MEILKFDFKNPDREIIKESAEVIKNGGVVIFPTDTVYGIAVNALDGAAIRKLFRIKNRSGAKPVSIIVKDVKTARHYAAISKKAEEVLNKFLPGPFTVILRKKEKLPEILTAGTDTIGLRIPKCGFTELLSRELEIPYTATSANISGQPPTGKIEVIRKIFSKSEFLPDLIVDAGDLPESEASAVIDLTAQKPKILRTGPVSKEKLFEILKLLE